MHARTRARIGDRLVEALLGAAIGFGLLCLGLWREAQSPALPGAHPARDLYTVVTDLGFASEVRDRILIRHLESLWASQPDAGWAGALAAARTVEVHGQPTEIPIELVFGPMLEHLGVPLIGRSPSAAASSLPLSPQPVREIVLSRALAVRMFGAADAALGRHVRFATMKWLLGQDDWVSFQVVGVVAGEFAGADIERPVQAWLGINGWYDVLFPEQQIDDIRNQFGAQTLTVRTASPSTFAPRLEAALRDAGEADAHITLVPGTGYHPERRARFLAISRALMLGLHATALLLLVGLVAFTLMRAARAQPSDAVRRVLGESPLRFRRRQLAAGLWSLSMTAVAAAAVLAVVPGAVDSPLPLRAAAARVLDGPATWIAMALLAASIAALPLWAHVPNAAPQTVTVRRLGPWMATLFALLFCAVGIVWFAGGLSVQRALRLAAPALAPSAMAAAVTTIGSIDRRWMFDRRSTRALESQLRDVDVALATAGPVGTVPGERMTVSVGHAQHAVVLGVNRVSANFFDVLGVTARSTCGPFDGWSPDWVYVNRRLLRRFGLDDASVELRLHAGEQPLRACGVVDDAHITDARAGLAPMLYAPLRERRDLRVAVTRGLPTAAQRARLDAALPAAFARTHTGSSMSTAELITAQLAQERGVATLYLVTMLAAGAIALATSLMLGRSAIALMLRPLATRRALGASRITLAAGLLHGRSAAPWLASGPLAVVLCVLAGRSLVATSGEVAGAATGALTVVAFLSFITGAQLVAQLVDRRLLQALATQ